MVIHARRQTDSVLREISARYTVQALVSAGAGIGGRGPDRKGYHSRFLLGRPVISSMSANGRTGKEGYLRRSCAGFVVVRVYFDSIASDRVIKWYDFDFHMNGFLIVSPFTEYPCCMSSV